MALIHKHDPANFSVRIADRDELLTQAIAAVTRLTDIITNINSYNTAQLKTALEDVAKYERSLIKIVARMV